MSHNFSDIEIAQAATIHHIKTIAAKLHIDEDDADALWCWATEIPGWEGSHPRSTAWVRDDLDDFD